MDSFYKRILERVEMKNQLDKVRDERESELLRVKDERTIPKLRFEFKKSKGRKWKRR